MPTIQHLDAVDAVTVETGAVRINADAPGFYLDGEVARLLALDIGVMLAFFEGKRVRADTLGIAVDKLREMVRLINAQVLPAPEAAPPHNGQPSS